MSRTFQRKSNEIEIDGVVEKIQSPKQLISNGTVQILYRIHGQKFCEEK